MKDNKIPMVLFGVIAVVAVVGLVMMFAQENTVSGEAVVGGPVSNVPGWYTNYKQDAYPDYSYRGQIVDQYFNPGPERQLPTAAPGETLPKGFPKKAMGGLAPDVEMNFKRYPGHDIPSVQTGASGRNMIGVSYQQYQYYAGKEGWDCAVLPEEIKTGVDTPGGGNYALCTMKGIEGQQGFGGASMANQFY